MRLIPEFGDRISELYLAKTPSGQKLNRSIDILTVKSYLDRSTRARWKAMKIQADGILARDNCRVSLRHRRSWPHIAYASLGFMIPRCPDPLWHGSYLLSSPAGGAFGLALAAGCQPSTDLPFWKNWESLLYGPVAYMALA